MFKYPNRLKAAALELYANGYSINEAALIVGVSPSGVTSWIKFLLPIRQSETTEIITLKSKV